MRLKIDVEMDCTVTPGDAALLMMEVATGEGQRVVDTSLGLEGGRIERLDAEPIVRAIAEGAEMALRYNAVIEVTRPPVDLQALDADDFATLPSAVLAYLRPSRYCQSDLFTDLAADVFGGLNGGAKVNAIRDHVATQLDYVPGSSDSTTTAVETHQTGKGVCRDYAHLVCALTRASGIPARYASVYGAEVDPPDFHAVAEVWLAGAWHLVDATGMGAVHEVAVIATGRDAADVAVMETVGWTQVDRQTVRVTRA